MGIQITPELVHAQFDPHYFYDYATFTGMVRHFVARTLKEDFERAQQPIDTHRRLLILGIYKEEYAAYEDVGAFLSAFLKWRNGSIVFAVEEMLTYRPGAVWLERLCEAYSISCPNDLFCALDLANWIPSTWSTSHPDIDAEKVLRIACKFIVNDCVKNQKRTGIQAYNKIKHGGLVVPDGSRYKFNLPSCPATIFENRDGDPEHPYILNALPMEDENIDSRERIVEQVQFTLRMLAAFYVFHRYPGFLYIEKECSPPEALLNYPNMRELLRFVGEVANLSE